MSIRYDYANLAGSFTFGASPFNQALRDLPAGEWLRSPNDSTNHLLWIVGHLASTRAIGLKLLGVTWTDPWPGMFTRGAALLPPEKYPEPKDVVAAWTEVSRLLPEALAKATPEMLNAAPPPGVPTFDGKVSGVLAFLAYHEAYHVGQVGYLEKWLGHSRLFG